MVNELTAEEKRKEWEQKYKPYIDDFIEFLKKEPANIERAISHPCGKEILDRIKLFTTIDINNHIWFSARKSENVFDRSEPRQHDGRFHYIGDVVIYLAENEKTAIDECLQYDSAVHGESFVQKFKTMNIASILNMSYDISFLDHASVFELGIRSYLHFYKAWYFTQFISYCARINGFNGLIYSGALTFDRCLALFNWSEKEIVPISNPVLWKRRKG